MRSSRIARKAARIFGAATISALVLAGVATAPAHAAHGIITPKPIVTAGAHGI
jgi:hypothetical protein